jgi:hypothetical protein
MTTDSNKVSRLEKEKEELKHEVFEQKIQGVHAEVMALGDTLHQRIDITETKNKLEHGYILESLSRIEKTTKGTYEHAKATNGRVTELEKKNIKEDLIAELLDKRVNRLSKGTRVVQFMHKYPTVTIIMLLVSYMFTIQEIRVVIFNSFETLLKLIF